MTDFRKMLEDGGCKPNHGCNVASLCMCAALEDAADEIERMTAEIERLRYEYDQLERQWAAGAHEIEATDAEIERLKAALARQQRPEGLREEQVAEWLRSRGYDVAKGLGAKEP